MGVVLLWLGADNQREQNHENRGTTDIIITTVISVVVVVDTAQLRIIVEHLPA